MTAAAALGQTCAIAADLPTPSHAKLGEEVQTDITEQVKSERFAALCERITTPTMMGLAFSLLPLLLFWPHLPHAVLLTWFGAKLVLSGMRCWDVARFRRYWQACSSTPSTAELAPWRRRFTLTLGLDSLTWGAAGWFFHASAAPELEGVTLAAFVALR